MLRSVALSVALGPALTGCTSSDPAPAPGAAPTTAEGGEASTPTNPGTTLDFGEPATLTWQPTGDLTGVLDLTVKSVREQRKSVVDGWSRDDTMEQARPYFVKASLTNAGETELSGQVVPLYLRDDRGTLGAPWTLGGDFVACQSGPLPEPFEADATQEMCLVFLVPDGARIQDMVFEPTEGYDPIVWTGDVKTPAMKTPRKRPPRARPPSERVRRKSADTPRNLRGVPWWPDVPFIHLIHREVSCRFLHESRPQRSRSGCRSRRWRWGH